MALSGLGWGLFALSHMAGNFLLFVSPEAYNKYGHAITSNPAIYVAEAGLVALLLTHVVFGIRTVIQNKAARKSNYKMSKSGAKQASIASRTMIVQGIIVLLFIVLHLITFKFGSYYAVSYDGQEMRDLFKLVVEVFQDPIYVGFYVVSVLLLCLHLSHGVWSALQSLGIYKEKYFKLVTNISIVYGILVGFGFAAQPVYVFLVHR